MIKNRLLLIPLFMSILFSYPLLSSMNPAKTILQSSASPLQSRWRLYISRPDDQEEADKLIKDAENTLKGHIFSMAINGEISFHLKGAEETLLKKIEGRYWSNKSRLEKIRMAN